MSTASPERDGGSLGVLMVRVRSRVLHKDPITAVVQLPNGLIATGSADGSVCVWDPSRDEILAPIEYKGAILALTATADGLLASAVEGERQVAIWDASIKKPVAVLEVPFEPNRIVASGRRLVALGNHGLHWHATIWDAATGAVTRRLEGDAPNCAHAVLHADGRLITMHLDGKGRIWDLGAGQLLARLEGHRDGSVSLLKVLPDGQVVSADEDGFVRVWNPDSGKLAFALDTKGKFGRSIVEEASLEVRAAFQMLGGVTWSVSSGAALGGSRVVLGCGKDLQVWDVASGVRLQTLEGHTSQIRLVQLVGPHWAVTVSCDGLLRIWDLNRATMIGSFAPPLGSPSDILCLPTGELVLLSRRGEAEVWNLTDVIRSDLPAQKRQAQSATPAPLPEPAGSATPPAPKCSKVPQIQSPKVLPMRDCPHCVRKVLPMRNGICPSCGQPLPDPAGSEPQRSDITVLGGQRLPAICFGCGQASTETQRVEKAEPLGLDTLEWQLGAIAVGVGLLAAWFGSLAFVGLVLIVFLLARRQLGFRSTRTVAVDIPLCRTCAGMPIETHYIDFDNDRMTFQLPKEVKLAILNARGAAKNPGTATGLERPGLSRGQLRGAKI
ncbi:MAG: WD40 repeat domain-containing protein [Verrucomicrobiia bacterium]